MQKTIEIFATILFYLKNSLLRIRVYYFFNQIYDIFKTFYTRICYGIYYYKIYDHYIKILKNFKKIIILRISKIIFIIEYSKHYFLKNDTTLFYEN